MKWCVGIFLLVCSGSLVAEDSSTGFIPLEVEDSDFRSLSGQSPFSRSLNLSDSLILTGIATVNEDQVATLLNKDTKETYVVSSKRNSQGWKMVELNSDKDLEKVAAKVSVDGGEVVTVRYGEWQLKPGEAKPGAGPSEGGSVRGEYRRSGDSGERRGPSPEFREKMEKLSEEQRSKLFEKMREIREKKPDLPREEVGRMMMETMDKMLQKK